MFNNRDIKEPFTGEEHHYEDILTVMYNKAIEGPFYGLRRTTTSIVCLWCIIGI